MAKLKGIENLEISRPMQLDIFGFQDAESLQRDAGHLSQLVYLYDAIPKYVYGKVSRTDGRFLDPVERSFVYRKKTYRVTIHPASIRDGKGSYKYYYPGTREEIVEDALRRFACGGQAMYTKEPDQSGQSLATVVFTLYQLQKELASKGHTFSISQLKDAILISKGAQLTLSDDTDTVDANIFPVVGLSERGKERTSGRTSRCFVVFHPLVTTSINDLSFREYNYETVMRYRRSLARWFHKQLALNFTQASKSERYHRSLSTILRDSGMAEYDKISHSIRNVKGALDEMKKVGVLDGYEVQIVKDHIDRRKITEAMFQLYTSREFNNEVIAANQRLKQLQPLTSGLAQGAPVSPLRQVKALLQAN